MTRHRDLALFTTAAVVVLALDQLTKARVRSGLPPGGSWPSADTTVGRFFSFTHVHNTGVAFGLFQGNSNVLLLVALVVVTSLLVYRQRMASTAVWPNLALGMIVAGAAGNAIDRVRLGHVTDFLDFKFWPVFNVADTCIVCGVLLLSVHLWREDRARAGDPVVIPVEDVARLAGAGRRAYDPGSGGADE